MPFRVPTPAQALDEYNQEPSEALFWTVRALRWKGILEGTITAKPGETVPEDLLAAIEEEANGSD